MPVRRAEAVWYGSSADGHGQMRFGAGPVELEYSAGSRFEEDPGSNPEEVLGAAHAGCFTQSLATRLTRAGFPPIAIHTTAEVHLEKLEAGWTVTRIHLSTEVEALGVEESAFLELADAAKQNCPISRALGNVEIRLQARLAR
jgi:osmotically inducible protein OsmC